MPFLTYSEVKIDELTEKFIKAFDNWYRKEPSDVDYRRTADTAYRKMIRAWEALEKEKQE